MQDIIRIPKKEIKKIKMSFIKKAIHFIKYHNAFVVGFVGIFVVMSSVLAASPQARDAVVGKAVVSRQGIDNTAILATDLDNFNFEMRINDISDDNENYYVKYTYKAMDIVQNIWKEVEKDGILTVSRKFIEGKDLGLHVAEELGEIIDKNIAYLKNVQEKEDQIGTTLAQETTDYTALIGLVLDSKTKVLPGYEPVIKPAERQTSESESDNNQIYDDEYYEDLIEGALDLVNDETEQEDNATSTSSGQATSTGSGQDEFELNSATSTASDQIDEILADEDNEYYEDLIEDAIDLIEATSTSSGQATSTPILPVGESSGQATSTPSTGSGQDDSTSDDVILSEDEGSQVSPSSTPAAVTQQPATTTPDLIEEALEVLEQGTQDQQVLESLTEGLEE